MKARCGLSRPMYHIRDAVSTALASEDGASLVQGSLKEVSTKANVPFRIKVESGGRVFVGSATNGRNDLRWIGVRYRRLRFPSQTREDAKESIPSSCTLTLSLCFRSSGRWYDIVCVCVGVKC